ncbi:MAG: LTA synthase family protein [Woeseiaceae bacterium]|jgi:phosphoglycerol transferase MdoB-like AlkP superfamily enzyme
MAGFSFAARPGEGNRALAALTEVLGFESLTDIMQATELKYRPHRLSGLLWFLVPVLVVGFVFRAVLVVHTWAELPHDGSLPAAFLVGAAADLVYASYFLIPVAIYLLLVPQRIFRTRLHRRFLVLAVAVEMWLLLFTAAAEWIFWDEFGKRFNFIAVDYLVYTHEVIDNILESYPVGPVLAALAAVAVLLAMLYTRQPGFRAWSVSDTPLASRLRIGLPLMAVPVLTSIGIDAHSMPAFDNVYEEEISRNGGYMFFAAFRDNELDFHEFYLDAAPARTETRIRELVDQQNARFDPVPGTPERRLIENDGEELRYNVIQIVVESLSAGFLGAYGNADGLTPNLDALAAESLVFTNMLATGTRTVRGMESLTLSVPPTPGRSIVKRPVNDVLQSTGAIVRHKGYQPTFFYGGYGYFDNMNDFFARNGFAIHDRGTEPSGDVTFTNAWGVSDEDLYRWVIDDADEHFSRGEPFFDFVMTTSNHRPYTYPEGRIDIPSGTGRDGAVKYTDHAIGQFIDAARRKPWFDRTIFVIVADHCASSAGKEELPVDRYRIPLIVYAPGIVAPGKIGRLASQIDIAPTLFGLLNWTYESEMFGRDLMQAAAARDRALIGTYQKLGLLTADNTLTILEPGKSASEFVYDPLAHEQAPQPTEAAELQDTIAYYQSAADLYAARVRSRQ